MRHNFFRHHFKRTLLGAPIIVSGLYSCSHHHPNYAAQLSVEEHATERDTFVGKVDGRLVLVKYNKKCLVTLCEMFSEHRIAVIDPIKVPRSEMKALVAQAAFDAAYAPALSLDKSTSINAAPANFFSSLNFAKQHKLRDCMVGRARLFHRG